MNVEGRDHKLRDCLDFRRDIGLLGCSGYTCMVLGLILLATWLRLWRLGAVPPGLWFDEGLNAMEAAWMLKTKTWPVFILHGQGREAMFYYLLALSISILGETAYAVRLVPALIGVLSIPLMYRWVLILFKGKPDARWIALISTAGLAVSFWYLMMNRVGYRANTLLPVLLLTSYFFWYGWRSGKIRYYFTAGLGLGLCQYTYLAGRLVPLVFIMFILVQTLLGWKNDRVRHKKAWLGLLVMSGVAAVVIAPMVLFFADYPELFWERGSDVSLKVEWTRDGLLALMGHLVSAGRVFIDGQDSNWRHHLLGRPVLDWFGTLGFWVGLVVAVRYWRRPLNAFLLSMLFVMWLPAVLSESTFHTLRLVGILPAYYVLVALGLLSIVSLVGSRLLERLSNQQAGPIALVTLLLFSGGTTFYDYFYRWAKLPEVYRAFDGPVVALAQKLATSEGDVIIPFYLHTHASMRYLLHNQFQEMAFVPETALADLQQRQNVSVVIPEYPGDDGKPLAFVWLTRDDTGLGFAYVSAVARELSFSAWRPEPATPIEDDQGNIIAYQYQVKAENVIPFFLQEFPQKEAAVVWGDNLALAGYEFVPMAIESGGVSNLYLAWEILGYTSLEEKMFLQLLDSQGNTVGQKEIEPISRKMYRWRDDGLILEQHLFELGTDLEPGLYFVRLGFFSPRTGQRLPAHSPDKKSLGDEFIVGPLYVSANGVNPARPQHPLQAMLGNEFEFLGYSVYPLETENSIEIELYWKTHAPVGINYTVFVQLLDQQNQVVVQADAQPLLNIYPTSRWQAGDVISDRFVLPVSESELGGNRLVTGMYDLSSGERMPAYNSRGELLPDGSIRLVD